jgi:hypothetical protein
MSYSFLVSASTKEDATRQIREQFDTVVLSQPVHVADKEAAVVATQTLVRLLADPNEGDEIFVSVHGSLSWEGADPKEFLSANLGVSVSRRAKAT